jgi:hypothetical protein
MFIFKKKIHLFIIVVFIGTIVPSFSLAAWSQTADFFVDPEFDLNGRNQIETQLIKTTNKLYFYADKNWYSSFSQKTELDSKLYNLATNFEYQTYPFLTNLLGFEDNPGVDNDSRIVVVLEPLKKDYGGYIQTGDRYLKEDYSLSNQGQIIYLNANLIIPSSLDFLNYELAHEFAHLITLKQKPEAETWFYELMSEFSGQAIGIDTSQITKQRAQNLLYSTGVNLRDWKNENKDYGKLYLFALYLREQFGNQLFSEALKYPSKDGIISFNEALKKRSTNFDEVYLNWLIANLYNTCEPNNFKYCYQDANLKDFSVIAYSYYLPTKYKSSLSVTDSISIWTGKWQKISGGTGVVKLKFTIPEETPISKIPYIIEDIYNKKTLGFFDFSAVNIQEVYVAEMGDKNKAIYFIPFVGSLGEQEKTYYYSWEAISMGSDAQAEQQMIEVLLRQIEELKRKIAVLEMQLAMQKTYQQNLVCSVFSQDLYYGMTAPEVKCLQQFLANLGKEIYPEGLVTGYYGPLTKAAVQRYQAMKGIITTGYFGPLTRARVNQELQ